MLGDVNVYVCPSCSYRTVTVDRDEGVTPMFLRCRNPEKCDSMAVSRFYRACDDTPAWEWYKPSPEETEELEKIYPGMKAHVERGGLNIRPINPEGQACRES